VEGLISLISERGKKLFEKPSAIFEFHKKCLLNAYHPVNNPDGIINLGTAENRLVWDLLEPKLNEMNRSHEGDCHYGPTYGHPVLHQALANFIDRSFGVKLDPQGFVIGNGATAIIYMLGFTLCNEGDAFIVPAPYYPGFDDDLGARSRVGIVPAHLCAKDGFKITREVLEQAWITGNSEGKQMRALLVTSPANPLGRTLSVKEIDAALKFAESKNIHCIFDEIYAHSRFPGTPFTSVLTCLNKENAWMKKVHLIYGMAKDFTLAGYRIGAIYSQNQEIVNAMRKLSYFSSASMASQRQVAGLLNDVDWTDSFLKENGRRLSLAFAHLAESFAPFFSNQTTNAGVFAWISLEKFMTELTFAAEAELHQILIQEARVNILPGATFHCNTPGWFRVCYANIPERIGVAADRIKKLLL
jgi:aspartate/methionine/tyrosine aminotransferase